MLRRFVKNERAASSIEMALVAPVIFLLLFGAIEFGLIMYTSSLLDTITQQAARYGKTGFDYGDGGSADGALQSREGYIRDYLKQTGSALLDPNKLRVETSVYGNIGQASVTGLSSEDYNFGAATQAVVYTIRYDWEILMPILYFMGNDGIFEITSKTVVQNENF